MKRILKACLIAICWLALWQFAAMAAGSAILLPSPWETVKAFAALAGTGYFWKTAGATLLRVAAGFLLGMAAGTALGVLTAFSRLADEFLSPIRGIVKATPVTSFIILVLLWFTVRGGARAAAGGAAAGLNRREARLHPPSAPCYNII